MNTTDNKRKIYETPVSELMMVKESDILTASPEPSETSDDGPWDWEM